MDLSTVYPVRVGVSDTKRDKLSTVSYAGKLPLLDSNSATTFFDVPDMICDARLNRGSYTQTLMSAAEIVVHVVKRNRVSVIVDFFRERGCQAREAPHLYSHRQVLTLNEASRNMTRFQIAGYGDCAAPDALHWTVLRFAFLAICAVNLDQHRVVNGSAKCAVYRIDVDAVPVCS
jgi:hypothetical protein